MLIELAFAGGLLLFGPETCSDREEWDGVQCVAMQLPEESNGRAIDCPDGSIGYVQDGRVECPAPPAAVEPSPAPAPPPAAAPVPQSLTPVPAAPAPTVTPVDDVATFDVMAFVRELFARLFGWLFA